jgi:hypothetical protein
VCKVCKAPRVSVGSRSGGGCIRCMLERLEDELAKQEETTMEQRVQER